MAGITCLVTIHGIGFQHAPEAGRLGYADGLQVRLGLHLAGLLGGDPVAEFGRPAGTGAIYVHSDWPPGSGKTAEGLLRIGHWQAGDLSHRRIDTSGAPLTDGRHPIAHVALVYAGLEEQQPHPGATLRRSPRRLSPRATTRRCPEYFGPRAPISGRLRGTGRSPACGSRRACRSGRASPAPIRRRPPRRSPAARSPSSGSLTMT